MIFFTFLHSGLPEPVEGLSMKDSSTCSQKQQNFVVRRTGKNLIKRM